MAPAPVLVHLTGPLRVERDGRELFAAEVASRKGRTLLRLLCTRRGKPLRRHFEQNIHVHYRPLPGRTVRAVGGGHPRAAGR